MCATQGGPHGILPEEDFPAHPLQGQVGLEKWGFSYHQPPLNWATNLQLQGGRLKRGCVPPPTPQVMKASLGTEGRTPGSAPEKSSERALRFSIWRGDYRRGCLSNPL